LDPPVEIQHTTFGGTQTAKKQVTIYHNVIHLRIIIELATLSDTLSFIDPAKRPAVPLRPYQGAFGGPIAILSALCYSGS